MTSLSIHQISTYGVGNNHNSWDSGIGNDTLTATDATIALSIPQAAAGVPA